MKMSLGDVEKLTSLEAAEKAIDKMPDDEMILCISDQSKFILSCMMPRIIQRGVSDSDRKEFDRIVTNGRERCKAWERRVDATSPFCSITDLSDLILCAPMNSPSRSVLLREFSRRIKAREFNTSKLAA